ncbi:hypothetical protein V8C86DRAFT_2775865 [Haematococcus lacustris]
MWSCCILSSTSSSACWQTQMQPCVLLQPKQSLMRTGSMCSGDLSAMGARCIQKGNKVASKSARQAPSAVVTISSLPRRNDGSDGGDNQQTCIPSSSRQQASQLPGFTATSQLFGSPMHQHRTRQASLPPYSFLAAPCNPTAATRHHCRVTAFWQPACASTAAAWHCCHLTAVWQPPRASTTSDRRRCHLTAVWQPPPAPTAAVRHHCHVTTVWQPTCASTATSGTTATSLLFGSTPLLPQRQPGTTAASQLFGSPHAQRVLMAWMTCTSATALRVPDCSGQTCS